MLNNLKWSSTFYEGNLKAYTAKVAHMGFNRFHDSLDIQYLLVEEDIGEIRLYLECNSEIFPIGRYRLINLGFKAANNHFKRLTKLFTSDLAVV